MDVNFIYKCDQCEQKFYISKYCPENFFQEAINMLATSYNPSRSGPTFEKYDIHDCKGDQSVYGVARLIGIEKVVS